MSFFPVKNLLTCAAFISSVILAVSLVTLASAYAGEHIFGLQPCILCLYQRIPYAITAALGLAGLVLAHRGKPKPAAGVIALTAPVFLIGAGIAFYHTGVEQHWWASAVEGCAIDFSALEPGELLAAIEKAPLARCDEISWQDPVFGLTMATWNVGVSLLLAAFALAGSILTVRKANGL